LADFDWDTNKLDSIYFSIRSIGEFSFKKGEGS